MLHFAPAKNSADTYVGRFAPSPTGPLHFGSLLAALASYLEAQQHQGQWLVRIEDLDPPREMPGADDLIMQALETYGFQWHGQVVRQSERSEHYQQALEQLIHQQQAFACTCSRKQLAASSGLHLAKCQADTQQQAAWRFLCPKQQLVWQDQLQGQQQVDLTAEIGDFVIKRRDGLWAYQLAVVVDDQLQGINHIVRGIDLIDSTSRQLLIQQTLGFDTPNYAHIPVACGDNGQKLSKQNFAKPLDLQNPEPIMFQALSWLDLAPPAELEQAPVAEQLNWAREHWQISKLKAITAKPSPF